MRILVSNDDGCTAPGIQALALALAQRHEVTIVAPDRNRSGASNSLTIFQPLRPQRVADLAPGLPVWSIDGTPTDCVHLALTGLLPQTPQLVVSGINHGANLGDDTLYSGTVAAAMEGRRLALPALAISNISHSASDFSGAAQVAAELVERLLAQPLGPEVMLNVNVPNLPYAQLRGFKTTRLGQRHTADQAVPSKDPRGRAIWWVGPAGAEQDAGEGTDFHAVNAGYVSITPLLFDLTKHQALAGVHTWLTA